MPTTSSCYPGIHQHLAPLPQCGDGTTENSYQPFVAGGNDQPHDSIVQFLVFRRNSRGPQRGRRCGVNARAPTTGRSPGNQRQPLGETKRPCSSIVGRLLDTFGKEIARSLLFLSRDSHAQITQICVWSLLILDILPLDVDCPPLGPAGFFLRVVYVHGWRCPPSKASRQPEQRWALQSTVRRAPGSVRSAPTY
jgi:hypothetical protein